MYPLRASDLTPSHPLPPVLFISSELWSALPYQAACRHELLRGEAEGGARSVVFKGSAHTMYCDLHLLGRSVCKLLVNMQFIILKLEDNPLCAYVFVPRSPNLCSLVSVLLCCGWQEWWVRTLTFLYLWKR